jgi:hypothetical protein
MYSTTQIAEAVEYLINTDDIYQIPFEKFLDDHQEALEEAIFKQFRPGQRKPVHLVARRIHAKSLDKAIEAGKEIPLSTLTYHQFTPGLFNRIKRLAEKNKIRIEY